MTVFLENMTHISRKFDSCRMSTWVHVYVGLHRLICVTWLIPMWDMTHSYMWDMTHSYVELDWWYVCDMTRDTCVWHDSCVTWHICATCVYLRVRLYALYLCLSDVSAAVSVSVFASWSVSVSVSISVYLSVYLSVCLYVCMSACLYACLYVCLRGWGGGRGGGGGG